MEGRSSHSFHFLQPDYSLKARVRLLTNIVMVVGAPSILSFLLDVNRFRIALTKNRLTTNQIAIPGKTNPAGCSIPARASTTSADMTTNASCTAADIRNRGGNRPGNLPPIANSPQGAPSIKPSCRIVTTIAERQKTYAAKSVTNIVTAIHQLKATYQP